MCLVNQRTSPLGIGGASGCAPNRHSIGFAEANGVRNPHVPSSQIHRRVVESWKDMGNERVRTDNFRPLRCVREVAGYGRWMVVVKAFGLAVIIGFALVATVALPSEGGAQSPPRATTIELTPRWSYVGWLGPDDTDIAWALAANQGPAGDLRGTVTAIWSWNSQEAKWESFFPGATDVPGVNDFSTFRFRTAYAIAYRGPAPTSWVVPAP